MYKVAFTAYCGISGIPQSFDDLDEARLAVADELRERRAAGAGVALLRPGSRWEFLTSDDAVMVGDNEGILRLDCETFQCEECGTEHMDADEAYQCCQQSDDTDNDDE